MVSILEIEFERRAAGKSGLDHVRNEDIRRQIEVDWTIVDDIKNYNLSGMDT